MRAAIGLHERPAPGGLATRRRRPSVDVRQPVPERADGLDEALTVRFVTELLTEIGDADVDEIVLIDEAGPEDEVEQRGAA